MPYNPKNPPKKLKEMIFKKYPNASLNDVKQFVHVFNSIFEKEKDEAKAFKGSWSVLKKKMSRKKRAEFIGDLNKLSSIFKQDDVLLSKYLDELIKELS